MFAALTCTERLTDDVKGIPNDKAVTMYYYFEIH